MSFWDRLFGASKPPQTVGEMIVPPGWVGGASTPLPPDLGYTPLERGMARVGEYAVTDSIPAEAAKAAWRGVTLPGRVATGEADMWAYDPQTGGIVQNPAVIEDAAELTGLLGLGGTAAAKVRPGNTLGIFGGRNAKNAPLDDLLRAETMEAAGQNADDIWRATGWGRGADGQWRFEIDDSMSDYNPGSTYRETLEAGDKTADEMRLGWETTVGRALTHDDAYSNYPALEDMHLNVRPQLYGNNIGQFNSGPEAPHIYLRDDTFPLLDKGRSVLLHEKQHAVQHLEGFDNGGVPSAFGRIYDTPEVDEWTAKINEFDEALNLARENMDQVAAKAARDNLLWAQQGRDKAAAHEYYRRLTGEVEARNVQTRRDFPPDKRRQMPPWATEDVPRNKQIRPKP